MTIDLRKEIENSDSFNDLDMNAIQFILEHEDGEFTNKVFDGILNVVTDTETGLGNVRKTWCALAHFISAFMRLCVENTNDGDITVTECGNAFSEALKVYCKYEDYMMDNKEEEKVE